MSALTILWPAATTPSRRIHDPLCKVLPTAQALSPLTPLEQQHPPSPCDLQGIEIKIPHRWETLGARHPARWTCTSAFLLHPCRGTQRRKQPWALARCTRRGARQGLSSCSRRPQTGCPLAVERNKVTGLGLSGAVWDDWQHGAFAGSEVAQQAVTNKAHLFPMHSHRRACLTVRAGSGWDSPRVGTATRTRSGLRSSASNSKSRASGWPWLQVLATPRHASRTSTRLGSGHRQR